MAIAGESLRLWKRPLRPRLCGVLVVGVVVISHQLVEAGSPAGQVVEWGKEVLPYVEPGTVFTNIAAGGGSSMAIARDGKVVEWGENYEGAAIPLAGLSNVVAAAMGGSYSLALKSDGTVVGWGVFYGLPTAVPITVPSDLSNIVAIAAGGYASLVLKDDGTVVQWGKTPEDGQTNTPAGLTNVVAIAAGLFHRLAVKSDGSVVAWGSNEEGQTNVPTGLNNAVAVSAGWYTAWR